MGTYRCPVRWAPEPLPAGPRSPVSRWPPRGAPGCAGRVWVTLRGISSGGPRCPSHVGTSASSRAAGGCPGGDCGRRGGACAGAGQRVVRRAVSPGFTRRPPLGTCQRRALRGSGTKFAIRRSRYGRSGGMRPAPPCAGALRRSTPRPAAGPRTVRCPCAPASGCYGSSGTPEAPRLSSAGLDQPRTGLRQAPNTGLSGLAASLGAPPRRATASKHRVDAAAPQPAVSWPPAPRSRRRRK